MRIAVVTPAPPGTTRGNRRSALRYAALLRQLGHTVRILQRWTGGSHDLLVALHAQRSRASVEDFARAHPGRPIIVVLTGTDLYGGLGAGGRRVLERATRLVVLQPEALRELDARTRRKATVILQSAVAAPRRPRGSRRGFRVVALGHLRAVKDPFLLAEAAQRLPHSSRIEVLHAGEALDAAHLRGARARSKRGSRWRWTGPRRHAAALRLLASADLFVQTSIAEGGSIALAEAVVSGLPILATRIPAALGMLGPRHPGLFPVGDAQALAGLLLRAETDARFRTRLARASRELAPVFTPDRERAAWRRLLARL
ncbi:MAG: TIGR04348 family glycosyltransferase [Planctomycetes bacterium]|nr:TIGR04348 family glycosyltransferase [Planctomycetota bacterium]